jgi:twitching motility protein PilT
MELKTLLNALLKNSGSDMHLIAGQPPTFRLDGKIERHGDTALTASEIEGLLSPYVTPEHQQMLRTDKMDVGLTIREHGRAFRCQVFLERGRLGAAIRVIPLGPPTLEQLELQHLMQPILQCRSGLVLVTGQTRSGKSTTTAAIIEALNRSTEQRVFTIEDPIKYEFVSKKCAITQHAVGEDVASYEAGLQMLMRSDSDIVVIGELRTLEVCWSAMTLADNNNLVFTVLHTNSATESLRRILDAFPEPRDNVRQMLARCLTAIVSQRLLPRANRPGRVATHEILLVTPRIRRMIAEGQTDMTMAIEAGRDQGMQSMDDAVLAHYKNGIIAYETAWQTMLDRERLGSPVEEVSRSNRPVTEAHV